MEADMELVAEDVLNGEVLPTVDLLCHENMPESEEEIEDDRTPSPCAEGDCSDSENHKETICQVTPAKRIRIDAEQLLSIRKRLFYDSLERPTQNVFYAGGERIDMTDPSTCDIQSSFFARIFNSMVIFSQVKFTERNTTHRNLAWEAQATERRLKKLMANDFKEFHLEIPAAISYILRALENIKHVRAEEMIFQVVPITCTIDRSLKQRLRVNGLELRTVNNSKSLSVNLNLDVKFLYAGNFQKRIIPDKGEKYYVAPVPFMGNYLSVAVSDLYDVIYSRTREYIRKHLEKHPKDPSSEVIDAFDCPNKENRAPDIKEVEVLKYLLCAVGRDVDLKRMDLDRNNVFALTSTIRTTPKYLNPKNASDCTIETTPQLDAEAVFLSSYTRVRIMEDGLLNFQIYSKACMYTSSRDKFPEA